MPSSQDRITGTGLTLLPGATNKTQAKYAEQWFSRHYIRQQRTVVPERQETNEVSQVVVPAYCLQRVSRPQCSGRRGGIQTEPSGDPELSRRSLESKETTAGCRREYLRRKLHSEFWRAAEGSPSSIQQSIE